MFELKKTCEDFIVTEIPLDDFVLNTNDAGKNTHIHVYQLEKINYTTERAVSQICRSLRIPRKWVSYAGTKDKNAVTKQFITIQNVSKEKITALELKDIKLLFVGYAKEHLSLGKLKGNRFSIVVRNLDETLEIQKDFPNSFFVPNYFDEQRFSINNVKIGLALLKKDFKEAVRILTSEDDDFSQKLKSYLETRENDFVGALTLLPKKTLLFFVHSVQSFIFNECLCSLIKNKFENSKAVDYSQGKLIFTKDLINELIDETLPLVGYDSDLSGEQEKILGNLSLDKMDFIIKQLPFLTLEGSERNIFQEVNECKLVNITDDKLNKEKLCAEITFTLSKGSYATIVIRQIFS